MRTNCCGGDTATATAAAAVSGRRRKYSVLCINQDAFDIAAVTAANATCATIGTFLLQSISQEDRAGSQQLAHLKQTTTTTTGTDVVVVWVPDGRGRGGGEACLFVQQLFRLPRPLVRIAADVVQDSIAPVRALAALRRVRHQDHEPLQVKYVRSDRGHAPSLNDEVLHGIMGWSMM